MTTWKRSVGLIGLIGVAGCDKSSSPSTSGSATPNVSVTWPSDATATASGNDAGTGDAGPSDAAAASTITARLALRRGTTVEIHAIEAKQLVKTASTTLPGGEDGRLLAWPRSGSLIVGRGVGTMKGLKARPVLGTISEGGKYTTLNQPGTGDIVGVITTSTGEVWLERCQKWGEDNPEEEGCIKRGFVRIVPTTGTGRKRPTQGTPPAVITTAPAVKLVVRKLAEDQFVLDCTAGGKTTTLFEDAQLYEPPTWRWLSADPPISFVRSVPAGSGEGGEVADPASYDLLRQCRLQEGTSVRLGPDGLWAESVAGSGIGIDATKYDVWRGDQKLATLEADELIFEAGWHPTSQQ